MGLSIIIVNWNTKNLLKKCVESIFKYSGNVDYELIVVDNASNDKSQELLSKIKNQPRTTSGSGLPSTPRGAGQNSKIKIILNENNLGFAKAINQGIKLANGKYVLLLNPDTEIRENTLEKMIEFVEGHPDCGILGGKILNTDGTIQASIRKFPDLLSQIFVLLKLHHFFKKFSPIKKYFALDFDYSKTQKVDQVMGSFFMIKKKLIDEIGLFDENFFLWFEEVDFCKRAKKADWKIYYYPEAEIIHYGALSFSQVLPLKNQWQFNKSLLYYFRKHYSFFSWLVLLLLQPISLFFALILSFFPKIKKFKKL